MCCASRSAASRGGRRETIADRDEETLGIQTRRSHVVAALPQDLIQSLIAFFVELGLESLPRRVEAGPMGIHLATPECFKFIVQTFSLEKARNVDGCWAFATAVAKELHSRLEHGVNSSDYSTNSGESQSYCSLTRRNFSAFAFALTS